MENKEDNLRDKQKALILENLPKLRYHIGKACDKAGISRMTFYRWLKDDKDFKERYEDIQERKMDDSEERLYLLSQGIPKLKDGKLIGWEVRPHFGALVTQLKAQAKDRGYGDHIVIDDKREDDPRDKTDEQLIEEMKQIANRYREYDDDDTKGEE